MLRKHQRTLQKIWFIVSCVLISAGLQRYADLFIYWREALFGEFWRLWTAHWVHVGWIHYGLNMLAFACLPFIFPHVRNRDLVILLLLLSPLISLSFYYILPTIDAYAGLSGVLHGLYVTVAIIYSRYRQERKFSFLVLGLVLAKLVWENTFGHTDTAELIGSPVLVEAHLLGVIWGGVLALLYLAYHQGKRLISPV